MNKKEKNKREFVIIKILSRLTDFQLQSNLDDDFANWCEDLREHIINFEVENEN